MKWASAVSELANAEAAFAAAADSVEAQLGVRPDLVLAFVSPHHADHYATLRARFTARFPSATWLGCSANGVIGGGHEVEQRPALSLTAASLPGVTVRSFHLETEQLLEDDVVPEAWRALIEVPAPGDPQLLLLTDPFTFDAAALIGGLDRAYPAARKIGGLASGGDGPGASALYVADKLYRSGAVGVALSGNLAVDTIVAQGCRPIGVPLPVTRSDQNLLYELNGKPALTVLKGIYDTLQPADQALFRGSLFIGLEMNESAVEHREGELLVRNLMGIDPKSEAIAVGAQVKPWQVVQFLLRDARTAEADLTAQLARYDTGAGAPAGALMFSCLGRGQHLFGRPDHDTDLFRDRLGPVPLGGFFCNGEIGPVGGSTFLHGYTSAFALFRERRN